jgi:hypothetical protein
MADSTRQKLRTIMGLAKQYADMFELAYPTHRLGREMAELAKKNLNQGKAKILYVIARKDYPRVDKKQLEDWYSRVKIFLKRNNALSEVKMSKASEMLGLLEDEISEKIAGQDNILRNITVDDLIETIQANHGDKGFNEQTIRKVWRELKNMAISEAESDLRYMMKDIIRMGKVGELSPLQKAALTYSDLNR